MVVIEIIGSLCLIMLFTLCGNCISWKSHLQFVVALSTIKAKYIVATETAKEAI